MSDNLSKYLLRRKPNFDMEFSAEGGGGRVPLVYAGAEVCAVETDETAFLTGGDIRQLNEQYPALVFNRDGLVAIF